MRSFSWRADFPIFSHQPELIFLDSASTTHKPHIVIQAEQDFYSKNYASVHRSFYSLAEQATQLFEATRTKLAHFIGAADPSEIIFTSNATEALNLAAWCERGQLKEGDEILLSVAEHHSNILPWQRLVRERGVKIIWLEPGQEYTFSLSDFQNKLSRRTRLVALAQASNVLADVIPVEKIVALAHHAGAKVLVDATQSGVHMPVDVKKLGVDYAAFSGHKMYGPTGVGFLYARREILEQTPPMLLGGGIVTRVTHDQAEWQATPFKFEAGTPNIAGVIGLGAAIDYMQQIGWEALQQHERDLTEYTLENLKRVPGLTLYGPSSAESRLPIFSFTLSNKEGPLHSHDVAYVLNQKNIAVRAGHHCAQPLMQWLDVSELIRASLAAYNTREDVDRLVSGLRYVRQVLEK